MFLAILFVAPLSAQPADDVPAAKSPFVYEVGPINPGLPAAGEPVIVDTPQATMESFLDAAEDEDWLRAAQALDFGNFGEAEQAAKGEDIARKMHELIERSIALDWTSIPDRPDAIDTLGSDKNPMAGVERRSITLARLDVNGRLVPFRLARIRAEGQDPVWLFSRQTVENVPALYDIYGPTKFEKSLPSAMRKQAFWTLAWWEVIALPLVIVLAVSAGALTFMGLRALRGKLDEDNLAHRLIAAITIPAALLALAGTFAIIRRAVFNFSGTITNFLDPVQITLIVVAIAALFVTAIDAIIEFATRRRADNLEEPGHEQDRDFLTRVSAVRRVIIVMIVIFAIGIVLIQSNIASTLGFSLLASAGVIGIVLAFGARKVLADLMASIQIAFAKTARIGDSVYYDSRWNYVERVGFTHVQLRTWDGKRIMAPVADFVGSSFENWTKQDPSLTMHCDIVLDHRAAIDRLREKFDEFVQSDEGVCEPEEAKLNVIAHEAAGQTVRALVKAPDPQTGWDMHCRLREYLIKSAGDLDRESEKDDGPVFLPRERIHEASQGDPAHDVD